MTALSTLVGGGGGAKPYPSGRPIVGAWPNAVAASNQVGIDYLKPFVPRADVTVDKLWWYRAAATSGNAYLGMVDASGNRLDDCAVDAVTTVGLHEVSTTNFDLTAGNLYYLIMNLSANNIAGGDTLGTTDEVLSAQAIFAKDEEIDLGIYASGTFPTSFQSAITAQKTRTNAAVPDPLTLTGWSGGARIMLFGAVPA